MLARLNLWCISITVCVIMGGVLMLALGIPGDWFYWLITIGGGGLLISLMADALDDPDYVDPESFYENTKGY